MLRRYMCFFDIHLCILDERMQKDHPGEDGRQRRLPKFLNLSFGHLRFLKKISASVFLILLSHACSDCGRFFTACRTAAANSEGKGRLSRLAYMLSSEQRWVSKTNGRLRARLEVF